MTNLDKHPFLVASSIIQKNKVNNIVLEFSKYVSGGVGKTLTREIIKIDGINFDENWVNNEIDNLRADEELAIHSKVYLRGEVLHIPMIDFVNKNFLNENMGHIKNISVNLKAGYYLFDSGNSYHCYFDTMVTVDAWYKYLGKILLLNPHDSNKKMIVDARWVGHALEHEFTALRWSKNSSFYEQVPLLVE